MAEAQRRTDQRVGELVAAVANLGKAFGALQNAFGSTVEEEGEAVLRMVVEGQGYRLLGEPYTLPLNGEVDVVMNLQGSGDETVWAVLEAKARLGRRDVTVWAQRMKSSGWQKRLADKGVIGPYLVYAFGIRVDPDAIRAAEDQGIGLLTGRGERITPKGFIAKSVDPED